ncbi:calcium/proton exchanger [Stagonosporopsis vannaccii]|nr:calcium/proton exchanger [Stagonosporopsis vannaccii]
MAEIVRAGHAGSDDLSVAGPQDCTHSERNDSITGPLPTEGYRIYDERPLTEPPAIDHECDTSQDLYSSFPVPESDNNGISRTLENLVTSRRFLARHWNRLMLVFVPLGIFAPYLGLDDSAIFILNCLATIPLADILCQATDNIASYMGATTGALVNVTMGNLTELVIFIQALVQRQYIIVRTSLLGSIVVNMLLVLGLAILAGETRDRHQSYDVLATRVATGLLFLATISLLAPSALTLASTDPTTAHKMVNLSRATSIILIVVYVTYLWTQMGSDKFAYKPLIQLEDPEVSDMLDSVELGRASPPHRTASYPHTPLSSPPLLSMSDSKSYDSCDSGQTDTLRCAPVVSVFDKLSTAIDVMRASAWTRRTIPVFLILVSTALISICSENLVSRVDHFVAHSPISKTMVGLILLPIVGNAAELVSGILFASRKQMDLAFAVSTGSAIQIALFVTPLVVLIAWGIDRDMSLQFTTFESAALAASSVLFLMLVFDSRCSILKGVSLSAGYIVIA